MYSSELHWRLVAKWHGISFEDFIEYEGDEQSRMVATYETVLRMDAVSSFDEAREAKKNNRKPTARHGRR